MSGWAFSFKRPLVSMTLLLQLVWLVVPSPARAGHDAGEASAPASGAEAAMIRKLLALLGSPDAKIALSAEQALSACAPSSAPILGEFIVAEGRPTPAARAAVRALGEIGGEASASVIYEQLSRWKAYVNTDALASLLRIGRPAMRWLVRADRERILPPPGRAAFHLLREEDLLPGLQEVWRDPGEDAATRAHAGVIAAGIIAQSDRVDGWEGLPGVDPSGAGWSSYTMRFGVDDGAREYSCRDNELSAILWELLGWWRGGNGDGSILPPLAMAAAEFFSRVEVNGSRQGYPWLEIGTPDLVRLAGCRITIVRLAATNLLRGVSKYKKDGYDALVALLEDPEMSVREMAVESLGCIDFPMAGKVLGLIVADEGAPPGLREGAKRGLSRIASVTTPAARVAARPADRRTATLHSQAAERPATLDTRSGAKSSPLPSGSCAGTVSELFRVLEEPTLRAVVRSGVVSVQRTELELQDRQVFDREQYDRDYQASQDPPPQYRRHWSPDGSYWIEPVKVPPGKPPDPSDRKYSRSELVFVEKTSRELQRNREPQIDQESAQAAGAQRQRRLQAIGCLGRRPANEVVDALTDFFERTDDHQLLGPLAEAIVGVGAEGVQSLGRGIASLPASRLSPALDALVAVAPPDLSDEVVRMLDDEHPSVRACARRYLSHRPFAETKPVVVDLLEQSRCEDIETGLAIIADTKKDSPWRSDQQFAELLQEVSEKRRCKQEAEKAAALARER